MVPAGSHNRRFLGKLFWCAGTTGRDCEACLGQQRGSEWSRIFRLPGSGPRRGDWRHSWNCSKGSRPGHRHGLRALCSIWTPSTTASSQACWKKPTKLPVCEVVDGLISRPNRVHVTPSNVPMTVASGRLVLAPRGDAMLPIDRFLRSLAADRGELAVGVILLEQAQTERPVSSGEDCGWHHLRGGSPPARGFPRCREMLLRAGFVDFALSPGRSASNSPASPGIWGSGSGWLPKRGRRGSEESGALEPRILDGCSASGWVGGFTHYKRRCTGESRTACSCAASTTRRNTCGCLKRVAGIGRAFSRCAHSCDELFPRSWCSIPSRRGFCR